MCNISAKYPGKHGAVQDTQVSNDEAELEPINMAGPQDGDDEDVLGWTRSVESDFVDWKGCDAVPTVCEMSLAPTRDLIVSEHRSGSYVEFHVH